MPGFLDALTPTTIANYARGAWDGVSINSWVLSQFKKNGTFVYDVGGDTLSGPIEAGRYLPQTSAPGMDISAMFVPKVRHARWNFTWGEKVNALAIDNGLLRRNSGDQALVRLKDTEIPAMYRDTIIGTGGLLYDILQQDANAYTGAGLPIQGLPTFLHNVGATGLNGYNLATKAATGSGPAATDKEVCATATSATYGGLSLAPNGLVNIDAAQYDAWMPVMVNTKSSAWTSTGNDAANAIELVLMHLVQRLTRFNQNDPALMPDVALLDEVYYRYLGAKKAAREQIFVMANQKTPDVPDTGFEPIKGLYHAGQLWKWEYNMQASTAYLFNSRRAKFNVQPLYRNVVGEAPLSVSGEEAGLMETSIMPDPYRRQWLVSATIPGQLVCEPRYFGCAREYA